MKLRPVVLCLTLMMALLSVSSARAADSEGASVHCEMTALLASITAPQISAEAQNGPEALNPLPTAQLKSDTSCCTQEEIQSCYASATPENGCFVSYVGCGRFAPTCFCAVICPY
jgi:hypothetical protein